MTLTVGLRALGSTPGRPADVAERALAKIEEATGAVGEAPGPDARSTSTTGASSRPWRRPGRLRPRSAGPPALLRRGARRGRPSATSTRCGSSASTPSGTSRASATSPRTSGSSGSTASRRLRCSTSTARRRPRPVRATWRRRLHPRRERRQGRHRGHRGRRGSPTTTPTRASSAAPTGRCGSRSSGRPRRSVRRLVLRLGERRGCSSRPSSSRSVAVEVSIGAGCVRPERLTSDAPPRVRGRRTGVHQVTTDVQIAASSPLSRANSHGRGGGGRTYAGDLQHRGCTMTVRIRTAAFDEET